MELSYSQISDWLQCRYKWFLGYDYQGTGLQEQAPSKPLIIGSAVHEALARLSTAQHGNPPLGEYGDAYAGAAESLEASETYLDLVDDCASIAWAAFCNLDHDKYKVASCHDGSPAVELEVRHDLPGGHTFRGFVDLLLEDRATGKIWVVDYKVRKRFVYPRDMETDMQLAVYAYMLKALGYDVGGVAYYEIRSDLLDAFVQNPQDVWVPSGRGKSAPFKFTRLYKSDAELQNVWYAVVRPAADQIAEYYDAAPHRWHNSRIQGDPGYTTPVVQPNICGRCWFQELCFEALRDGDPEFIAEENFRPKERK